MHTTFVLLVLISSVFCDAPYPAQVKKPHVEYGVPHEVSGVPELRVEPVKLIKSEYNYEIFSPKKIDVDPHPVHVEVPHFDYDVPHVVPPYSASIEKLHGIYEVPELGIKPVKPINTEYKYEIFTPKKTKLAPFPIHVDEPHFEYYVPQVITPYSASIEKANNIYEVPDLHVKPVKLINTEYNYEIFTPKKTKLGPFPIQDEIPHFEYSVPQVIVPHHASTKKPHEIYEIPELHAKPVTPIKTAYKYEIFTPKKTKPDPFPVHIDVPHLEYGVPHVVAPFSASIEKPDDIHEVPKLRAKPVKPINTEYNYEIFTPKKTTFTPFPVHVDVPYFEYGVPQVIAPNPASIEKPYNIYKVPELFESIIPIKTDYKFEIFTPKKVQAAHVKAPQSEYGVYQDVAPYSVHIEKPHDVYVVPELREELVKPIKTEYKYEVINPKKVEYSAPYSAREEVPHLEHRAPLMPTGPYPARI